MKRSSRIPFADDLEAHATARMRIHTATGPESCKCARCFIAMVNRVRAELEVQEKEPKSCQR